MDFDFLQQFPTRMKTVGVHSLLIKNSAQKTTWKQYGVETFEEQINLLFALLLYMMEQSLRDEICTIEEIAGFLDELNMKWLKKSWSYEQCRALGDFMVNVILCDEGRAMYFSGFNFTTGMYEKIHISYVYNEVIYQEDHVRHTTYKLTEDGYNLLLSTLEIENNMKLTIQEMVFKLHLEKASYDKAADDIRNIFHRLRIQLQKIQEAMLRIRQNALRYTVADYKILLEENLSAIEQSRQRFDLHRQKVNELVEELTNQDIHVKRLELEDRENLDYLKQIETYLVRSLDEHQRILTAHFDMKALYTSELEKLSQMAMIKRFELRSELDEPLLNDVRLLERIEYFLRPLFNQLPTKIYDPNLALQKQIPLRRRQVEEEELLSFDEEIWQRQQLESKRKRLQACRDCLEQILELTGAADGKITLSQILEQLQGNLTVLIPSTEIFQEVVIELLRGQTIWLTKLRQERQHVLQEQLLDFQLNSVLLDLFDMHPQWQAITALRVGKCEPQQMVQIDNVPDDTGVLKRVRCSDFQVEFLKEGESPWPTN